MATITVGAAGDYTTIQGAIDSSPSAGDVISILDTGVYNENLVLKNSGMLGNPIRIQNDSGGTVEVSSATSPVLLIATYDYWTIDGINFTYTGIEASPSVIYSQSSDYTDGITLNNLVVTLEGGTTGFVTYIASSDSLTITNSTFNISGGTGIDGVELIYSSNLEFSGNTIAGISPTSQDDGLVVTGTNINIENNTLYGGDGASPAHPDGIVIQGDGDRAGNNTGNVTIHRNTIYDYDQLIYVDAIWGDFDAPVRIYNNLLYETGTLVNHVNINGIIISGENGAGAPTYKCPVNAFNNTIDVRGTQLRYSKQIATALNNTKEIYNNIFVNGGYTALYFSSADDAANITIDYNDYSDCDNTPIYWGGTAYTVAAFITAGFGEANSVVASSGLNANYKPDSSGDAVVDVGKDLSTIFTTDKDGNTRGAIWDIGAYEFIAVDNAKLSLITFQQPYSAPIPTAITTLTTKNKQHLIWDYAGITWGAGTGVYRIPWRWNMAFRSNKHFEW